MALVVGLWPLVGQRQRLNMRLMLCLRQCRGASKAECASQGQRTRFDDTQREAGECRRAACQGLAAHDAGGSKGKQAGRQQANAAALKQAQQHTLQTSAG